MCGLAGVLLAQAEQSDAQLDALVARMGGSLQLRGPDDSGVWVDAGSGVGLAHQRLSILDLSAAGHQPMPSSDGRYVVAYNGEIYNFADLRSELAALGHGFRGHSDTEVLLAAVVQWGFEAALTRFNGMFAIALWDRQQSCLWLARDRVGKKPLYYGWAGRDLVFGSELKALWQHPGFVNDVNRDALTLLLRLDYIPAPHCIHQHAFKLMPSSWLRLDAASVQRGPQAHDPYREQQTFWSARTHMSEALGQGFAGDVVEAEQQLDNLLRDAVAGRMVADVPVGVFLSGGTDSSVVTALMQSQSSQPVRSFTIGFQGSHHDEAQTAKQVAAHLGTDHTELYVSGADALAVVPTLPAMFDEPFADSSQVPTALLCRLARQQVTVALSGDGGDELFYGYTRYQRAMRNWNSLQRVPSHLRRWLAKHLPYSGEAARAGGLAAVLAELDARGIGDVYRNRISRWRDPAAAVMAASEPWSIYQDAEPLGMPGYPREAMMLADFMAYLPDDLLCKVDRTSMAVSLEARCPLLDWRVAEFAWSLPIDFKYRDGTSKYLLKKVLRRYLPDDLVDRNKQGFGAPVGDWLQHDLKDWANDLLDPLLLARQGYLDANRVSSVLREFQQGQRKWHTHLWNLLMFQAWLEHWRQARAEVTRAAV